MKTLHAHRAKVGRIVVKEHRVTVFVEDGKDDPRSELEKAPIPDTADRKD